MWATILCSSLIFVFLLLTFIFFKLNIKGSVELTTFLTFSTAAVVGFFISRQGVEVTSVDLIVSSFSLFAIYLYFSIRSFRKERKVMPDEVRKVLKKIKRNKKRIKRTLKRKDLSRYLDLKMEFEKGNVKSKKFQKEYKLFYRMKISGFEEKFYKQYFDLLSKKVSDPEKVLRGLSEVKVRGKRRVHLAFATKLIHTINPDLPLYSSMISEIFNLPIGNGTLEERIKKANRAYEKLIDYYLIILKDSAVLSIISELRQSKNWKEGVVSDMKLLDMIIKEAFDS